MLQFNKLDYDFFHSLLDAEKQAKLRECVIEMPDEVVVKDMDIAAELYDWLNDLVVYKGLTENQDAVTDVGRRLNALSDYVFTMIAE